VATFLDTLPGDAIRITADPVKLAANRREAARMDSTRTAITECTENHDYCLVRSLGNSNELLYDES
jgi:hypothetical protein